MKTGPTMNGYTALQSIELGTISSDEYAYQLAMRNLRENHKRMVAAVAAINATRPRIVEAWLTHNYPQYHFTVKIEPGKTPYSMNFVVKTKERVTNDKLMAIFEALKAYLDNIAWPMIEGGVGGGVY